MPTEQPLLETFADLLKQIALFKDRPALTDASDGATLSFSQLHSLIHDLLKKLPADIPTGARVLLYDLNPLDWVALFFASALRGWVAVPLDIRVSADFMRSVEELTAPALIITGDKSALTSNHRILKISALKKASYTYSNRENLADPDAPVEILFTSGTWARPKGVVLSQRNILANVQQVLAVYHHKTEDISLAVLPLSHAYQQTVGLLLPLLVGSQTVFLTRLSSEALTTALRKYRVRTMLTVPRVLSLIESALLRKIGSHRTRKYAATLIRSLRFLPRPLRRILLAPVHKKIGRDLNTLVVGGAPLSLELDHFFQGLGYNVVVGYGASECAPVISISFNQKRVAGEIGVPLPRVTLELNDKAELQVKGKNVFLGYWPNVTRPAVFNTEDVVVVNSTGSYVLKGRTKNLIIYPSGDKIFCEDIEQIANQIPGVEDCCVVSIPSNGSIQLHGAIKGESKLKGNEESIKQSVNKHLPFGIRLDRVIFLEQKDFPYTHTLKANRQKVQALCVTTASASLPN